MYKRQKSFPVLLHDVMVGEWIASYVFMVEMSRLVALRYGGESASVPGCLCDGTGTLYRLYRLFSVT